MCNMISEKVDLPSSGLGTIGTYSYQPTNRHNL